MPVERAAVLGVGTDIVGVERLAKSLRRERFVEQVFSPEERNYCRARARPAQHFAARFAAKEAFLKAVGRGVWDGVALGDIEVVNEQGGAPRLRLGPSAARALAARGAGGTHLSLSHEGDLAVAFVVVVP